jgi:hypothetical protein
VVDILSDGRLDLGIGAGYRIPEFDLFDHRSPSGTQEPMPPPAAYASCGDPRGSSQAQFRNGFRYGLDIRARKVRDARASLASACCRQTPSCGAHIRKGLAEAGTPRESA